jgi:hypothetical protein
LIMVRRNELACRDEWSRSLWQPREGQHSNGDTPFQRSVSGPLPPALAENLHSVLNGDKPAAASSQGEDVLLSEARIVSEAHEPWESPQRPFPTGHFDPRTAIFRAREAYRERVRTKTAAERQSASVEAIIEYPSVEDVAVVQPEETNVDPVDRMSHEPDVAGDYYGQTREADSWLSEPVEDEEESLIVGPALPAVEAVSGNIVLGGAVAFADEFQFADAAVGQRATHKAIEQTGMQAPGTPAVEEASSATAGLELAEREGLPDWYRADLPRICRTCRDYRPSAEGQRGWCANSWAFTHRRLVLEDDPAPCQSAIGDWWLPVDDVWLVAADVSSHGRATPLLDRLTAKAEQQRRGS